jgi:hypothetical protein
MVANHPEKNPDAMVSRMRRANPAHLIRDEATLIEPTIPGSVIPSGPLDFNIKIHGKDGTLLVRLFERDGKLACEGDQERMEEAAKIFLYQMLQWSGQIGLRWKDDVKSQVEGQ